MFKRICYILPDSEGIKVTEEFDNLESMESSFLPRSFDFDIKIKVEEYEDDNLIKSYEYYDPMKSVEHFPGFTNFHEVKPGAKVELFRTELFNKSAEKIKFINDTYRKLYIKDIRDTLIKNISNAIIHEVSTKISNGVRKGYIKLNELGGRNGGRLYYKAYIANRKNNIVHVYLLYTFYKKDKDEVDENEKDKIINDVLTIDKNYVGV